MSNVYIRWWMDFGCGLEFLMKIEMLLNPMNAKTASPKKAKN